MTAIAIDVIMKDALNERDFTIAGLFCIGLNLLSEFSSSLRRAELIFKANLLLRQI